MNIDMQQSFGSECFWEYIRANISAADCVAELAEMGVTITVDQLNEARMRDVAAIATNEDGEIVKLVQC